MHTIRNQKTESIQGTPVGEASKLRRRWYSFRPPHLPSTLQTVIADLVGFYFCRSSSLARRQSPIDGTLRATRTEGKCLPLTNQTASINMRGYCKTSTQGNYLRLTFRKRTASRVAFRAKTRSLRCALEFGIAHRYRTVGCLPARKSYFAFGLHRATTMPKSPPPRDSDPTSGGWS
jgi:hypothetical protein